MSDEKKSLNQQQANEAIERKYTLDESIKVKNSGDTPGDNDGTMETIRNRSNNVEEN